MRKILLATLALFLWLLTGLGGRLVAQENIAAWQFPMSSYATPSCVSDLIQSSDCEFSVVTEGLTLTAFSYNNSNTELCGVETDATAGLRITNTNGNFPTASIVFKISAAPFRNIMLEYDHRVSSSNGGYATETWSYSTNGTNFTDMTPIEAPTDEYSHQQVDFSSIVALNGSSAIWFKLTVSGTETANAFTAIDNVVFKGTAMTCLAPLNMAAVTNGSPTETVVSWDAAGTNEESYTLVYGTNAINSSALDTYVSVNAENVRTGVTSPYTLTGLAANTTYHIYVRANCDGDDNSLWSHTTFTTPERCAVSGLTASDVTGSSATLSWTTTAENAMVRVFSSAQDNPWEADGAIYDQNVTGTTCNITGLSNSVTYYVYAKAVCSTNNISESISTTFRTQFADIVTESIIGNGTSTDYTTPFNTYYKNSWNQAIYTVNEVGHGGTIGSISWKSTATASMALTDLRIYMGITSMTEASTTTSWVSMDDLTLVYSTNSYTLGGAIGWETFYLDTPFEYDGSGNLVVVVAKKCSNYNSSVKYEYTTKSNRVMYRQYDSDASYASHPGTATGTRSSNLPNIKLAIGNPYDLCLPVSNIIATGMTSTGFTASWTPNAGETSWIVKYGPVGFNVNTAGTSQEVSGTPSCAIAGLTPNTSYDVYVKAVCAADDQSGWTKATFTTNCNAVAVPFSETFEDVTGTYAIPDCYERVASYTSGTYVYPYVITNTSYSTYSHGGTKALYMYTYSSSNAPENIIALPPMEDINTLQVSLWARASSTIPQAFEIGYMKNGEFTSVKSIRLTTSYEQYFAYMNVAPADAEKIAIRSYHASSSTIVYVDDIEVDLLPTCVAPENVVVSGITTATASVSWTDVLPTTSWQYQLGNGEITTIDAKPIELTGLTSNTDYTIKVRSACAGDEYSEWSTVIFTTPCESVTVFPYSENFEGFEASTIPLCWDNSASTTSDVTSNPSYVWGVYSYGDNKMLRMYNYMVHDGTALINSQAISIPSEGAYLLSFDYSHLASCGAFNVKVSTDGGASFTTLGTYSATTTSYNYTNPGTFTAADNISLAAYAGQTIILQFYASANYGSGAIFVDNIVVREMSSDNTILSYAASTEQGSAICNLDNEAHTISVVLRSGYVAGAAVSQTIVLNDAENATIKQQVGSEFVALPASFAWYRTSADTTITYKVIAENGDEQIYTANVSIESCAAPSDLVSEQTSTTNVNLSWTPAEGTSSWNFFCTNTHLTASELEAVSEYSTLNTASVSYAVTGENTYYWYVRTNCGGSYSAWVEGTFSSWENCVAPTNLATEVIDDDNILISWNVQDNLPVAEINLNDDFERNDIQGGAIDYTNSTGNLAWSIVTSGAHNGNNCMKSASGNTSSTSSISVNINSTATSQISFWYKVSSEANYDKFYFTVDNNNLINGLSGTIDWTLYEATISSGSHTLTWKYTKDVSTDSGSDCVWIDDLSIHTSVAGGNSSVVLYKNNAELVTLPAATSSYTDESLAAGNYCYKIKTICREGNESAFSEPVCQEINSCIAVTNISTSNILDVTATLNWTRGSDETAWNVKVNDAAPIAITESTTGVTVNGNAISYVLTGLEPLTHYTVAIQTNCGGTFGQMWPEVEFTTERTPATLPYVCDFEDATENGAWVLENGTQINKWNIGAASNNGGDNGLYISNDNGATNAYAITSQSYVYAYRPIHVAASSDYTISFDWKANGEGNYDLLRAFLVPTSISLVAGNANGMTYTTNTTPARWIDVANPQGKLNLATEWQHSEKTMSIEPGMYNMVFFWKNNTNSGSQAPASVDNLSIVEVSCPTIADIEIENITTNTADVTWTERGTATAWDVVLSTAALTDEQLASAIPENVNAASYQATELTQNTPYYIYVRAHCSESDQSDWVASQFRTECGDLTVPFTETFADYTATNYYTAGVMPDCWSTVYNGTSAGYSQHVSNTASYAPMSGDDVNYLFVIASSSSELYGNDNIVMMPPVEGGYANRNVSFAAKTSNSTNSVVKLGYMNGDSFVNLTDVAFATSSISFSYVVPNTVPEGAKLALKFSALASASTTVYYGIDNVTVREVSTDNTLLSYSATTAQGDAICEVDNEAHTISVVLRAGYDATAIAYTIVPNDENATVQFHANGAYYDLPATPRFYWYMTSTDTTVTYKVTAENGAEQLYLANVSVESCGAPSALVSEQTSLTNVNCSWTPADGTTVWNFYCSTTQLTTTDLDALTSSDYTTVTTASASVAVVGETPYYWYVRADCGGSYSAWMESSFTTWENCAAPTNLATALIGDNDVMITWNVQDNLPLGPGIFTDDFERETVAGGSLTYTNDATYPWVITDAAANGGTRSIKSGNAGVGSSTSSIEITADYPSDGTISFYGRVSSEQTSASYDWDNGRFYIDGVQQGSVIINTTTFNHFTYNVTAGTHTFRWEYKKDGSINSNDDCFYVDDITMPGLVPGGNSSVVLYKNDVELVTLPATQTSYTDEGLAAGHYCYTIKTLCREGSESELSDPVCQDINDCLAVTNLSAGSITDNSAVISWTRGTETSWNLKVNDGTPVALTEEGVTVNGDVISYALTGLEQNTTYTVAIQSNCDGTLSQNWASVEFTTERTPATLPYVCGFEEASENANWILENGTQTNKWYIGTASHNSGANGLYISNDNGVTNNYANTASYVYAYRPIYIPSTSEYVVSFDWLANGESSWDLLRAFLVPTSTQLVAGNANGMTGTTNTTPTGWNDIANPEGKLNLATEWQHSEKNVNIDAGMYNLVFFWKNDGSTSNQTPASVDNINIHALTCPAVGDLAAAPANITSNSAVITWTERGPAEAWEIVVSPTTVTDFTTATIVPLTETTYSATSLNAESTYHVYVRANCDVDDNSSWTHITFTTVADCPVPDGLEASAVTGNSATITWNGYTATQWALQYRIGASGTWTNIDEVVTTPSYTMATESLTTYYVRVKAVCDDDQESAYSPSVSFTTSCGAVEIPWEDSFENGHECWSMIDEDGDGNNWFDYTYTGTAHTGSYSMASASWNSSALTPNNWFITPAIDLTSQTGTIKLSYFIKGQDVTDYHENYKVAVSTTNTEVASFTTVFEETLNSNEWDERAIDLSTYAGQTIYVAFVHYDCTNQFYLVLDDVKVFVDNSTDAILSAVTAPTHGDYSTCALTDAEQVKISIVNNGGAAISDFEVSYSINDGTPVTETVRTSIAPAQTYEYTFAQTADLSAVGAYTITASVNLTGDENADNNTASMSITSGDATVRIHAMTDSGGGQSWVITNTETNEIVAERTQRWEWDVEINNYACVDASQCYRIVVNDDNGGMTGDTYVEILYNDVQVAGSTEPGSFNDYSLVAERFTPNCQSSENDIITFSVPDMVSVDINNENHTVTAEISFASTEDLSAIIPTITVSEYAEITLVGDAAYVEGDAQDFTTPVDYTVVAENGTSQTWTVTVTRAAGLSSEKDIIAFTFAGQTGESVIDATEHTVTAVANWTVNMTSITPTIEISHMATISPESGVEQDFSAPVTYTVTAEDESTQEWVVTITQNLDGIASLPYSCDFEDATENANWALENGTYTNKWYIGTAASNGGANGLYISSDNGTSNTYNNNSTSSVYAYRSINFEEAGRYTVAFDWRAYGETTYDGYDVLSAYLVPASEQITDGTTPSSSWITVESDLEDASEWQHSHEVVQIPEAGIYSLAFYWENDGTTGDNPPAAVDNVNVDHAKYTITASKEGLGTIEPEGEVEVLEGATQVFTMTPMSGFALSALTVDGVDRLSQVVDNTYTFENVSANHTIVATFEAALVITATAGDGGSISPAGQVSVGAGANATFTVTANEGYVISSVLVDNEEQISDAVVRTTYNYTFNNVTTDHTIAAAFVAALPHTITATASAGGTITPSGQVSVPYNGSQTFQFTPDEGYRLANIVVDNGPATAENNTYTFNNVIADHTINANFSINSYTLTIHYVYADNTEAAPDHTETVAYNAAYSVVSPEIANYTAAPAVVEGTMPAQDVEVTVTYNANTYNLTIHYVYANNTEAAPDYSEQVAYGTEYSVTSPVIVGYVADQPIVAGTMPAEDVTVTVRYTEAAATYTITATASANGTIEPSGETVVNEGDNKSFTITANDCYRIASVMVDGVESIDALVNGVYTFENVTANHTIAASFEIATYTITASASEGGTISETSTVNCGGNKQITIAPASCYRLASVMVDGVESIDALVNGVYTFENVTADHTIAASFELIQYTITATAGENGTINGESTVNCGANQSFTITANDCYRIASVMVDGVESINALVDGVYTFENVTADHTIAATFELSSYTITATAGENGTISETSAVVNCGENKSFTITANDCYRIASVMVDGVESIDALVNDVYTFENVTADHTIAATFELIQYTITATAGENGTINGENAVNCGASQSFTIIANDCYRIASVMVDGVESIDALVDGVYTFENVTADHTIAATFETITYTITVAETTNGTITPATSTVDCGANITFTITPDAGYMISEVLVDGANVGTSGQYTFSNVDENHEISAAFEEIPDGQVVVLVNATAGGSVEPIGTQLVNEGDDFVFTVTPDDCYDIASVTVNEVAVDLDQNNSYTIEDVMEAQTVHVTFAIRTYTINAIAGDHGTITPASAVVNCGSNQQFEVVADEGYSIASVMVDETDDVTETVIAANGVYTFENVTETHEIAATFSVNSYNLTIHYVYADDSEASADYTALVEYGTPYSVESPVIEGYTADQTTVAGTMPAEDVTVTVRYTPNTYTLTIHYVYADDSEASADYTAQVAYGTPYSVESPVIAGYTADQTTVAGTMPAEDVTVTVRYTANTYALTIHYVYADDTEASADYTAQVAYGTPYSVESPVIAGYTADQAIVAGTMPAEDVTVTVRYTVNNYTLTIHYVYADNTEAAPVHTETLAYGSAYSVESPVIEGYTADQATVAGTMPAQDVEVTVRYTANPVNTYTITATAGNGGTINPLGTVTVNEGADQAFTITANAGYRIASVLVDNADATSQLVNGVYTFTNVTANHTIAATFEAESTTSYTIIATAGSNGTITPNGVVTVNEGANQTFRITPNEGYRIATVTVDGNDVIDEIVDFAYTFYNVTANHSIDVTFTDGDAIDEYTAGSMSVYPNPNNGMFNIDFSNIEGNATYQLIDARGAVVETRDINVMDGETMNFSYDLRPGAYFVRIITADKVYVEQIVVE